MFTYHHFSSLLRIVTITITTLCLFLGFSQLTEAASGTPVVVLTVNDGSSATVVNGSTVTLAWFIDGPVTNCSINNGVGAIDTSVLPVTGNTSFVVTNDVNSNYVLSCDQISDAVVLNMNTPTANLTIREGTDLMANNVTGRVDSVTVDWTSTNANRCSLIGVEPASTPGVITYSTDYFWDDYWNEYTPNGTIRYDGSPRSIIETTTFHITCYNDDNGEEASAAITLNVTNPPEPEPPLVNIWSPTGPTITRDELYGYAYANVSYNSQNVSSCTQKAYYADGTQYPNPPNWNTWRLSVDLTNIKIATTTRFEVTCGRGAVTLGGNTYPATSTTKSILIEVLMPGNVGGTLETWDRTTLPPVTVTVVANPNPTVKNPVSGRASTNVTVERSNASFCYARAYYTDGRIYDLPGWTRATSGNRLTGTGSNDIAVSLSTTTRLSVECIREFDQVYGTSGDGWYEEASVVVEVQETGEVALPPELYLYGNGARFTAGSIYSSRTEYSGFNNILSSAYLENNRAGATSNRVSFPFVHPYGVGYSDTYDIFLRVCDENDGQSTFRLYTEDDGLVGSYTTDSPTSPHELCGTTYGTSFYKKVASGIRVNHGDSISVECDTPDDGEYCRLGEVFFGAGDDGEALIMPQVSTFTPNINLPIVWLSENATNCGGGGELGHWAYPVTGARYSWWGNRVSDQYVTGNYLSGLVVSPVSTSTTFTLTCWRTGDSQTAWDSFRVNVPTTLTTISSEVLIGSGPCIDPATLELAPERPGYGPNPTTGYCMELVDLAAVSPAASLAGVTEDGVNGTYDNLNVLMVIENLGPGALSPDSKVTYMAKFNFLPIYGLPSLSSIVGIFSGSLAAPINPTSPTQSPTLTRTFDGLPFGTHEVCARVNLDGSPNFPEAASNGENNTKCSNVTLPVPKPPMSITSDRQLIRRGQSAIISWSAHTSYKLDCVVRGAGGVSDTFDASVKYPIPGGAYTNSMTTGPINSASEFTLQCTEPITGTTFSEKTRVEVIPDYQEI